ncbi:MAG: glycoside hydrolase family 3 C-terminal domain-containing protein [Alphaproteobacteria bacterium]|nr:glycoside hydrolase family 3 C-terminal domain-containing protein [Alphaproteobacteria bacterium]
MRARGRALGLALLVGGGCSVSLTQLTDDSGSAGVLLPPLQPMPLDAVVEARVDELLAQLTLEEKVAQMHGTSILPVSGRWPVADNPRLGIPPLLMADGPRGTTAREGTSFPVGILRGATWNPEVERLVGTAVGRESAAAGVNVVLAPVLNLAAHPRYGRAQETYGEDPALVGPLAVAFVEGAQTFVMASAKHLAVNNIENSRFELDAQVPADVLRETFLPQFERVVREGRVASVMSAYNSLNGSFCGENAELLTGILKGDWGFQGFVESDWVNGTHDAKRSVEAGLDIEMPVDKTFDALAQLVERGEVDVSHVDEAVRRILRRKLEFGLESWSPPGSEVLRSAEHLALAREVAARGMVLLRNEGDALPLAPELRLAVVGRLADLENLGDTGSSDVPVVDAVTVKEGLEAVYTTVSHIGTDTLTPADETTIAQADAVVVVVGLTDEDEGEYVPGKSKGDREGLALSEAHAALVQRVSELHERVIVVLEGGSAITVEPWIDAVEGVVHAWYPGEQGGHALADLFTGSRNFEGRLPVVVPRTAEQLPPFDNVSLTVRYGPYHGQRHLDAAGEEPRFALGFGLSYTTFGFDVLQVDERLTDPDGAVLVDVGVSNTGAWAGSALVTVWLTRSGSDEPRRLASFARLDLAAGGSGQVALTVPTRAFASWDEAARGWRVQPGSWLVEVGPHAGDLPLQATVQVEIDAP